MPDIAALIIGIGGWDEYTKPLIDSLQRWEPDVRLVVIDNESVNAYPQRHYIHRTERISHAQAIMHAKEIAGDSDWTVVLSNDVRCTGPFVKTLEATPFQNVIGPKQMVNNGYVYIEGWCVCASRNVWRSVGGFDTRFKVSSWEDVDFSVSAVERGYFLREVPLPFIHLDQRQRFTLIPNYWDSELHNMQLMDTKHRAPRMAWVQ